MSANADSDPTPDSTDASVDVAPFGFAWVDREEDKTEYYPWLTDGSALSGASIDVGQSIQIDWRQPRSIARIVLRGYQLPKPEDVEISVWYRIWPDNGGGGWSRLDDPFNGEFVKALTDDCTQNDALVFQFRPLSKEENPKVERQGFDYRHTYKLRISFKTAAVVSAVEAYTHSVWRTANIKLDWKASSSPELWQGELQTRNAHIVSTRAEGQSFFAEVRYADNPDRLSEDRGVVIYKRSGWESFSVFVDDVVRESGLYVRDIDAFVSDASKDLSVQNSAKSPDAWEGTVLSMVAQLPEQSMEQVMAAMPAKPPREAHLGVTNQRQEFTIHPSGNIALWANSLRSAAKDSERRSWGEGWKDVKISIATEAEPVFNEDRANRTKRFLEDNYQPVIHTQWSEEDLGLDYHQECFATMLLEPIGQDEYSRQGDEPIVLLNKIQITNASAEEKTATIHLQMSRNVPMSVRQDGLLVLDHPSDGKRREALTPVRGRIDTQGKGSLEIVQAFPHEGESREQSLPTVKYTVSLAPGATHAIVLSTTHVELLDDAELNALVCQDFGFRKQEALDYWNARYARGMQYEVPEQFLNDLWKANLWHTLITTDRDPVTGLYQHGAATFRYQTFPNETAMVAQSLEMRGDHEEASRLLNPMLACQGVKPLPGNFKSREGLMYACHPDPENDAYTAQGYNMHHGWSQWKLAEHYLYTRDAEYLRTIADNLVAASDWVIRERQATKALLADGTKPLEYGLAPAGDLEDVEEYLYWYATNAYYYIGMKMTNDVLREINHPEVERLMNETEAYREDILESVRSAIALSPVVKLKDGTWAPYVPPRTECFTHLKEGWIREGLYPSLHLLDGELLEPHSLPITWLLEDLEDSIFLSVESGYGVQDEKQHFFNFGGFNLQPNLCPNAVTHLRRDEISHFIRVFYNTCWASLFPDTMCFAEWVPYYGKGGGPLYKTPDECKFIQFMRDMIIWEEGDELRLGAAVPRKWMEDGKRVRVTDAATFYGPMDIAIESKVSEGAIEATVKLPSRNPAKSAWLRLRHPEGKPMQYVTINGCACDEFDPGKERIELPVSADVLNIVARYV